MVETTNLENGYETDWQQSCNTKHLRKGIRKGQAYYVNKKNLTEPGNLMNFKSIFPFSEYDFFYALPETTAVKEST